MAGLFLVRRSDPDFAESALAVAREQFALHGFRKLSEHALPGWQLLHAPFIIGGPESLLIKGEDLVAVAGTFACGGRMGRPALEKLLAMDPARPDWSQIAGQFAALVHKGGRTFLFTDYFAAFQLFHDTDCRLFSTSLLSTVNALPRVSFDKQGVYEFAFNVVPIGNDTVFSELKTLGPHSVAELTLEGIERHPLHKPLPPEPVAMPLADRINIHRDQLGRVVRAHLSESERVFAPLSGGLDSRLALATLRAEGCNPNLYVYGPPHSSDVEIARRIGAVEGFEVDWLDKLAWPKTEPDAFAAQVDRNFHQYDGLPSFGDVFDYGADAAARDARHVGGALSVSGGCGEVYRNFFFLPDRPLRAGTVARSFFSRFAPSDVTQAFEEREFLQRIEGKLLAALGAAGTREPLPRTLIEQIYPTVRCRSFFGREISLEGRYGPYLMPFLDHQVVREALTLPLALKNAGAFEAALLNAIDPSLARHPSAYGHDFASRPSFRHRFAEWSTRIRPAWVRQKSYAFRRRLGLPEDPDDMLPSAEHMNRVIDTDYPVMRHYFRPERISDSTVLRRVACLEYMASRLGARLAVPF